MIRTMLLSVLVVALLGSFNSVFAVAQSSVGWEIQLNGSVFPSTEDAAWDDGCIGPGTPNYCPDGGEIITDTPNDPSPGILRHTKSGGNPAKGETGWMRTSTYGDPSVETSAEWRVKLVSGSGYSVRHRGQSGALSDVGLNIQAGNGFSGGCPGGCSPGQSGSLPAGTDVSEFHTIRFTRSVDGYRAYLGTDPVPFTGPFFPNAGGTGDGRIGIQLTGGDGELQIDYFRATATGAFEPIPEPASLALLSLGGLLMIRRRR